MQQVGKMCARMTKRVPVVVSKALGWGTTLQHAGLVAEMIFLGICVSLSMTFSLSQRLQGFAPRAALLRLGVYRARPQGMQHRQVVEWSSLFRAPPRGGGRGPRARAATRDAHGRRAQRARAAGTCGAAPRNRASSRGAGAASVAVIWRTHA